MSTFAMSAPGPNCCTRQMASPKEENVTENSSFDIKSFAILPVGDDKSKMAV